MKTRTVGVSPKVSIPSALLAVAGLALLVLDQTGVISVDDSLWAAVLGASGVSFGSGFAANPGTVVKADASRSSWGKHKGRSDRGYAEGGLLLVLLVILVIVLLCGAFVHHGLWLLVILLLLVFLFV